MLPFHQTTFVKSVGKFAQLPVDQGNEIAFAGRSNAGKSSALNAITAIKNLAKTSKTPGRTQTINLFQVLPHLLLIDLPGYGYAKVPLALKQQWQQLLNAYLTKRQCLRGLILLMDIRHPLKIFDVDMLTWAETVSLPVHILLTKADKLTAGRAKQMQQQVQRQASYATVQIFSSVTGEGLLQVKKQIDHWVVK